MPDQCPQCNWPLDAHDRDVRFRLPDCIAAWDARDVEDRTEGNDTFLRVDFEQFFMRATLPIHLEGEHLVALGVWLEVDYETIESAFEIWDSPEYAGFTCAGQIANDLPQWPTAALGARVVAEVRHTAELPYIIGSDDPAVQHILDASWNHASVLDPLAAVR